MASTSAAAAKDRYCRKCGWDDSKIKLFLLMEKERNYLKYYFQEYNFESETLAFCSNCRTWASKQGDHYKNRKTSKFEGPLGSKSIAIWDYANNCPRRNPDGTVQKSIIYPNRSTDGRFLRVEREAEYEVGDQISEDREHENLFPRRSLRKKEERETPPLLSKEDLHAKISDANNDTEGLEIFNEYY